MQSLFGSGFFTHIMARFFKQREKDMNRHDKNFYTRTLISMLLGIGFIAATPVAQANYISQQERISISTEIDDWYFSVSGAATNLQVAARDKFGGIGNIINPPGDHFNPEIALFVDDGALDAGDLIQFDKDGLGGGTSAHIWTTLNPGNYLLRVASADFTDTTATTNSTGVYTFDYMFALGSNDIQGGGVLTLTAAPVNVPAPATILLIGFGLTGIAFSGRASADRRR